MGNVKSIKIVCHFIKNKKFLAHLDAGKGKFEINCDFCKIEIFTKLCIFCKNVRRHFGCNPTMQTAISRSRAAGKCGCGKRGWVLKKTTSGRNCKMFKNVHL